MIRDYSFTVELLIYRIIDHCYVSVFTGDWGAALIFLCSVLPAFVAYLDTYAEFGPTLVLPL